MAAGFLAPADLGPLAIARLDGADEGGAVLSHELLGVRLEGDADGAIGDEGQTVGKPEVEAVRSRP
jgi:hypothetical protein